jgi:hypothetical protein
MPVELRRRLLGLTMAGAGLTMILEVRLHSKSVAGLSLVLWACSDVLFLSNRGIWARPSIRGSRGSHSKSENQTPRDSIDGIPSSHQEQHAECKRHGPYQLDGRICVSCLGVGKKEADSEPCKIRESNWTVSIHHALTHFRLSLLSHLPPLDTLRIAKRLPLIGQYPWRCITIAPKFGVNIPMLHSLAAWVHLPACS